MYHYTIYRDGYGLVEFSINVDVSVSRSGSAEQSEEVKRFFRFIFENKIWFWMRIF